MKVSYAYGPVTVGYSNSDHDTGTASSDTKLTAYNIAYTVSDELSVSYGSEELSVGGTTVDAEYTAVVVAYTCLLYTSPSPRDVEESRMPSSA